jgi:L-ascorbate metabolism protein UlaG (beta-lactamase superfamily)
LTYLGVAGWKLDDGADALLFDPYFTRARVENSSAILSPDAEAIARFAPAHADVILVGHSHYDHLLDVPTIAKMTGALVVGTESTQHVGLAAGLPASRLRVVHGGETFQVGPFAIRAISALHSLTGQASDTTIPSDVTLPMAAEAYVEGGTLQYLVRLEGRTVLFMGTANFIESELEGLRPDVAIVAVGLREKVPDYCCRLMRALGNPSLVMTNHFDAHRQPLGAKPMDIGDEGLADLQAFANEIHACSPTTRVVVPKHFEAMTL